MSNATDKRNGGFTLIELMVVVAIVGILVSIASSAYQDYTARAQVTEAMTLMDKAKTGMAEFYSEYGTWPVDNLIAGLPLATSISGKYILSVDAGGSDGTIDANFRATGVAADLASRLIQFSANDNAGSITWTCRVNIPLKLMPRICQAI